MNTICNVRKDELGWIVEAKTPSGARLVVTCAGTRREALSKALAAEGDPA